MRFLRWVPTLVGVRAHRGSGRRGPMSRLLGPPLRPRRRLRRRPQQRPKPRRMRRRHGRRRRRTVRRPRRRALDERERARTGASAGASSVPPRPSSPPALRSSRPHPLRRRPCPPCSSTTRNPRGYASAPCRSRPTLSTVSPFIPFRKFHAPSSVYLGSGLALGPPKQRIGRRPNRAAVQCRAPGRWWWRRIVRA